MSVVPSIYQMAKFQSFYPSYFRERQGKYKVNPIYSSTILLRSSFDLQKQIKQSYEELELRYRDDPDKRYMISFYHSMFIFDVRNSSNLNILLTYVSEQTGILRRRLNNAFFMLDEGEYKARFLGKKGYTYTVKLTVRW